jgi:hypothetical protein
MKQFYLPRAGYCLFFLVLFAFSSAVNAQNVGVGTDTPAASAQLEVNSTKKGFLPPRMTAVQRDSIVEPVAGLILYCSNCGGVGGEMQFYNGSSWRNMIGAPAALPLRGQPFGGGIIVYTLQPGDPGYSPTVPHGLISTAVDISSGIAWDNGQHYGILGLNEAIGSGNSNTTKIVAQHGAGSYAAKLCADLVLNGYDDWYLPSFEELRKLIALAPVFPDAGDYWTSNQTHTNDTQNALAFWLSFGDYGEFPKSLLLRVRAFRSF